MEKELRTLKAPKRNEQTIQQTFEVLQTKTKTQALTSSIFHTSILACVAIIFFILLALSNDIRPWQTSAKDGSAIVTVGAVPYSLLDKQYLIGRGLHLTGDLKKEIIQIISSSDVVPTIGSWQFGEVFEVIYRNGVVEHYYLWQEIAPKKILYTLTNEDTKQSIELTAEQYFALGSAHPFSKLYVFEPFTFYTFLKLLGKFTLILVVYSSYLVIAKKASPLARQSLTLEFTFINMALKLAFLYFVLFIVSWQTAEGFNYYNWLIALIWIVSIFLLRKFKEYLDGNSRRKWLEIPISIFFYYVCFLIYIF